MKNELIIKTLGIILLVIVLFLSISSPIMAGAGLFNYEYDIDYESICIENTSPHLHDLDTDGDGLSDWDEICIYHTNPFLPDSDFDGYDDRMQVLGVSLSGEQMPAYIQFPGTHPLVSAYPKIEVEVDDTYIIFTNKEISFETRTVETFEHTYGTITTTTTTSSIGEGGSHTTNNYQDVINRQKDIEFESSHSNRLTSDTSYYSQKDTFGKERVSVKDVGGSVTAGARMVGPVPTAGVEATVHASYTDTNTITENSLAFNSRGQSIKIDEGGSESRTRIFEEIEKSGSGKSDTIHSSITRTTEKSVSKVDLYTIGSSHEWAEINTQDTSNWGAVRVSFGLRNTGTAPATNINNLRLRVEIGDYVKTFPPLDTSGIEPNDLLPGDYVYYPGSLEIPLRLEEIKAIDSGVPVEITIIDYDYDQKLVTYGAFSKGVLIQIDEDFSGGNSNMVEYLVPVIPGETYYDVLRKLNYTTFIQNEPVKLIDLESRNGYLHSLNGKLVTDWSWWTVKSEGIENKTFLEKEAKQGSKLLLTYHKDSDRDFYTDREELKRGRDPNDGDDYPSPFLTAVSFENAFKDGSNNLLKNTSIKLSNFGDYDAYGLEARIFSPDNSTEILNEYSGGSVRVKAGQTIILNEELSWTVKSKPIESSKNFALDSNGGTVTSGWEGVIDGDISTIITGSTGWNTIYFELPEIYLANMSKIYLYSGQCSGSGCGAYYKNYKLYFSLDNVSWELIAEGEDYTVPNNVVETFEPRPVKYMKFMGRRWQRDGWGYTYGAQFKMRELELYGSEYIFREPILILSYNDPRGHHKFVSNAKIENLDADIEVYKDEMLPLVGDSLSSPEKVGYHSTTSFDFSFLNPTPTNIDKGKLAVSFSLKNGTVLHSEVKDVVYPKGFSSKSVDFVPAEHLSCFVNDELLVTAVSTDYQGVILSEDTALVEIENPIKILDYSENISVLNISYRFYVSAYSEGGTLEYQWILNNNSIENETQNFIDLSPEFLINGNHVLSVKLSDGTFTKSLSWKFVSEHLNNPPVIESLPNITIYETENVSISPIIHDPDGDNLTITISEPIGNDGFWQTFIGDKGNYTIVISASDGFETVFENFTLIVLELNSTEDSEEDEEDSEEDEDEGNDNTGSSNENTFTGGGSGGGSSDSAELNPADSTSSSDTKEDSLINQVQIEDLPQQANLQIETAPTGLSIGVNRRIKATGVLIAGLVAVFIYTLFDKKPSKSGPFKQAV